MSSMPKKAIKGTNATKELLEASIREKSIITKDDGIIITTLKVSKVKQVNNEFKV